MTDIKRGRVTLKHRIRQWYTENDRYRQTQSEIDKHRRIITEIIEKERHPYIQKVIDTERHKQIQTYANREQTQTKIDKDRHWQTLVGKFSQIKTQTYTEKSH